VSIGETEYGGEMSKAAKGAAQGCSTL
jgi:hypothetical protein